jgi:mannitol-1-phosphate/altronate dehydrogenase
VGFGLGPIQAGLFLYEAFRSGNFGRLVVAEIIPHRVGALREAGGMFALNIAHSDRVETVRVGPVEIYDPASGQDRDHLVEALAKAEEISTSVPSIHHYVSEGAASLHCILSDGLRQKAATDGPRAVVYAAENHNRAAEKLEACVSEAIPPREQVAVRSRVQFLNTEIGKISGIVSDTKDVQAQGLACVTPGEQRAFLVESFNQILISKIRFEDSPTEAPFQRGITVFEEKDDLVPFKEAKIYGHNATHALAAYVGGVRGFERMADLGHYPDIMTFIRNAFICESGESLVRKYSGVDPLFTPQAFRAHVDILLGRMFNPYLCDTVQRVGRDPQRKLGWDDHLVGTMRLALRSGVHPSRDAFGAAAALSILDPSLVKEEGSAVPVLRRLWSKSSPSGSEEQTILRLIEEGRSRLALWRNSGYPDLEGSFERHTAKKGSKR